MAFLRAVVTSKTAIAAAIPAAFALSSLSSSSSSSSSLNFPQRFSKNLSVHLSPTHSPEKLCLVNSLGNLALASVQMDAPLSNQNPPAQVKNKEQKK